MPAADELIIHGLERRLAVALGAPPERFSGELAAYLQFLSSSAELRAVVTAALAQETEGLAAEPQSGIPAAHAYAAQMSAIARVLARQLGPWLADGTLPGWVGPLLAGFDEQRALAALASGDLPWAALRRALEAADLYAGEVERLFDEAGAAEARALILRAAEARAAATGLAGCLARLWGHVRHRAPKALPNEW